MAIINSSGNFISGVSRYRIRSILSIALFWTLIDLVFSLSSRLVNFTNLTGLFLRMALILFMSLVMGYLFVFALRNRFRNYPLWLNFFLKSIVLFLAAFLMNFLIHVSDHLFIRGESVGKAIESFMQVALEPERLWQKILYWVSLFMVTQLFIEVNEKYSPGVFLDILMGKYFKPKVETRIVMFIDLRDSTTIAEKIGHQQYFLFIREFVYQVSTAVIEYKGRIYQYVGDEIVVSWPFSRKNVRNCLAAVIEARKNLQTNSEKFRREFNVLPEFRVGIHAGEVTIGEIGVVKKDLAMSGDTMNTTARIRSACNELNQKFLVSKEFIEASGLKEWQSESLGVVDLKGKEFGVELFALKI